MKITACLIVAFCLLSCVFASYETDFDAFVLKYEKQYASDAEMKHRREVFAANVKKITEHNADSTKTYQLGMNKFGDMSAAEFAAKMKTSSGPIREAAQACAFGGAVDAPLANNTFDWRATDNIPPVQNEGECGSVSYMIVANQVSSMLSIDTKTAPQVLSAQQMIDCVHDPTDSGCNGGDPWALYNYVQKYGLETNESYPYADINHKKCSYQKSKVVGYISGTANITNGEAAMQKSVRNVGPVAVLFDASTLQLYKGGVFHGDNGCQQNQPDHVLLLVGYSMSNNNSPFWIAQNVWGEDWGINGYLYILMGKNVCGIAECGTYITKAYAESQ